jgi:O-6-methylguanine DNA methyltransferase
VFCGSIFYSKYFGEKAMQRSIYYTHLDSPWGRLFLAGTEIGVCNCTFLPDNTIADIPAHLAKKNRESVIREAVGPLGPAMDLLKYYFSGEADLVRYPLDLQGSPFALRVWSALRKIPLGKVATYGEIAARIGKPRGARAVGQACGKNPVILFVPCHRVVAAHGELGGFGSGLSLKEVLLGHEGLSIY